MRYFWDMVTGDLVATGDGRVIACLLADGYIEVSKKRYVEIAKGR